MDVKRKIFRSIDKKSLTLRRKRTLVNLAYNYFRCIYNTTNTPRAFTNVTHSYQLLSFSPLAFSIISYISRESERRMVNTNYVYDVQIHMRSINKAHKTNQSFHSSKPSTKPKSNASSHTRASFLILSMRLSTVVKLHSALTYATTNTDNVSS